MISWAWKILWLPSKNLLSLEFLELTIWSLWIMMQTSSSLRERPDIVQFSNRSVITTHFFNAIFKNVCFIASSCVQFYSILHPAQSEGQRGFIASFQPTQVSFSHPAPTLCKRQMWRLNVLVCQSQRCRNTGSKMRCTSAGSQHEFSLILWLQRLLSLILNTPIQMLRHI